MTGLPGRTFESWGDFTDLVHRLSPKPGEPFPGAFRGHSDATWLLEPSLLRLLRKAGVTNEQTALELERSALTLFQQDAHLYVDEAVLSDILTTLGWWTLMQHHGTPTRLIDWSSSILVAAYFAVSSDPECDGALWIVQKKTLVDVVNAACGPSPSPRSEKVIQERFCTAGACPAIHFFDKVRPHQRMAAQEGSFSVCENVLTDHDAIVRVPTPGQVTKLLRKYVIPASLKRSFWQRLTKEGTSASKLFPGLDGFARSIGEELVHNAFTATG